MNASITQVSAEEIFDSRSKQTLSVTVCAGEHCGTFDVPSGASTGANEAIELRDADGGMKSAIAKIENEIAPALIGVAVSAQADIDRVMIELDGTQNKSRLGGNSTIGVSIAAARAAARAAGQQDYAYLRTLADIAPSRPTPRLFVNVINGGKHAVGGSPLQEHWIVTKSENVHEAFVHAQKTEGALRRLMTESGRAISIGDEGGIAFSVQSLNESFELLRTAVADAGTTEYINIGADAAATSFFNDGVYTMLGEKLSATELHNAYMHLRQTYDVCLLEDPFAETSMYDFAQLQADAPSMLVIGDDLTTTNASAIQKAAQQKAIQGVIIKPNQIGTLTETIQAMQTARGQNIHCIVSHRSGETNDVFIADLAYAFGCYGLKAGAPSKPERMLKYERLLSIAHE